MKRFFLAAMIIVAFSCVVAVTAGADSMTSTTTASPAPNTDMSSQGWVGKTTVDLLINLGVPTYTEMTSNGETIVYVKHEGWGPQSSVNFVRQFDVDSSGKVTAERDSES